MNIQVLTYFLKTCETLNYSKTAEWLFVSPQGISKSIKVLEDELGHELFIRTPSGLQLTPYGDAMKKYAQHIVEETELLRQEIRKIAAVESHKGCIGISIGCNEAMGSYFVKGVQEMLTKLGMIYVDADDLRCEEELTKGNYDIAIFAGPIQNDELEIIPLLTSQLCAFVHRSHPFYSKDFITVSDLKNQKIVTTTNNFRTYHILESACRYEHFEPNIIATTMSVRNVCANFVSKDVIGISSYPIMSKIIYKDYKVIPLNDVKSTWQMVVATQKNRALTQEENNLMKEILILSKTK